MIPEVEWLVSAEEDLEDIFRYIGIEQHQIAAARRLVQAIRDKADVYARQPSMGTILEEVEIPSIGGPIRSFRVKSYLALYQEIDSGIVVLRVVDGRRDLTSFF